MDTLITFAVLVIGLALLILISFFLGREVGRLIRIERMAAVKRDRAMR